MTTEAQKRAIFRHQTSLANDKYREEEAGWASLSEALHIVDPKPEREVEVNEVKTTVESLFSELSDKQQFVIQRLYYDELTLDEVSKSLNVVPERVRQIRQLALEKLRHAITVREWDAKIKISMR
ncbi:MAG TPA: sigma-70 family RNA polymerase sigma factor [Patescibacteria group bacterium]|nr:sigma-70 family RNA polymerase sigma factor [Patescibacteria group bacterium]